MQIKIFPAVTLLLFMSFSSRSQSHEQSRDNKASSEEAKKIFAEKDKDFAVSAIPEKWNNESAVIIAQKYTYNYSAQGIGNRYLEYIETTRRRIKILDKAAVENFSTFYFYSTPNGGAGGNKDNFGIEIIKPDKSVK